MRHQVLIALVLCLCMRIAVAERWAVHIHRQDGSTTPSTTTSDISASTSVSAQSNVQSESGASSTDSTTALPEPTFSSSNTNTTSTASDILPSSSNAASTTATATSSGSTSMTNLINANQLPLQPRITPGLGVAGVILILTGAVYTFVGIKNRLIHVSLSAGYLTSLAVTVLIIYVMNLPISYAVQGAYVVAVVLTGAILGAASTIFADLTEGLGCLAGGFCFSMWLLVMKPGGLLTSTSAKAIFIASIAAAAFATSFSHYTRAYALIVSISFAGATAIVLGIDCFSRAGLKEFWLYLWALNENLFPLGTTSYPLTRGLRVEIAAIFIIFLAGIVSQMKLWKVIKARRAQRASAEGEEKRALDEEETIAGRRIENLNTAELNRWEAVYGDNDGRRVSTQDSGVGIGDMDSMKGPMTSTTYREDGIEAFDESSRSPREGMGLSKGLDSGAVMVRVVQESAPPPEVDEEGFPLDAQKSCRISELPASNRQHQEEETCMMSTEGSNLGLDSSKQIPSPTPAIVPLPFCVPESHIDSNRSSVATFADEELTGREGKSRRKSGTSFLSRLSKRASSDENIESIAPHGVEDDRASSLAATMDGHSEDGGMMSMRSSFDEQSNVDFSAEGTSPQAQTAILSDRAIETSTSTATNYVTLPTPAESPQAQQSMTSSIDPTSQDGSVEDILAAKLAPSVRSAADSKISNITKDSLPSQLSRVVMSFRTNEWAKHLSNADAPALDELQVIHYPDESRTSPSEAVVPVNVKQLRQTPNNAQLPPARSHVPNHTPVKVPSRASTGPGHQNSASERNPTLRSQSMQADPRHLRSYSNTSIPRAIVESPIEDNFPPSAHRRYTSSSPYKNGSTLMGKRDTMLRNKSYNAPKPEYTATPLHSSPPSSIGSTVIPDDDNMSLSARRDMIRSSSLQALTRPASQNPVPHPLVREKQLASWRQSVQQDLQSQTEPKTHERQQSVMWQERHKEEQRKVSEARRRGDKEKERDEKMRKGEMLSRHKEAMAKMQRQASKNA